jgi:chromosome segregation ATPase
MRLPDGTLLMHGATEYDPRKAHEYYLRTRKLKGRQPGRMDVSGGARAPSASQDLSKKRKAASERVKALKDKLTKLKAELRKRKGEAEVKRQEAAKPDTAADKAEKARDSKKYRDKHKQELKTKAKKDDDKKTSEKGGSVADLEKAIDGLEKKLAAAVARQRALG